MREFAYSFYHSAAWKNVRDGILMRDKYLCQKCGAPAEVVHHKTHLTPSNINDPNISLNASNLISLCADCHFEEHRGEHGRGLKTDEGYAYEFDENGQLVPKARCTPPVN